jgi:hypothetical protein
MSWSVSALTGFQPESTKLDSASKNRRCRTFCGFVWKLAPNPMIHHFSIFFLVNWYIFWVSSTPHSKTPSITVQAQLRDCPAVVLNHRSMALILPCVSGNSPERPAKLLGPISHVLVENAVIGFCDVSWDVSSLCVPGSYNFHPSDGDGEELSVCKKKHAQSDPAFLVDWTATSYCLVFSWAFDVSWTVKVVCWYIDKYFENTVPSSHGLWWLIVSDDHKLGAISHFWTHSNVILLAAESIPGVDVFFCPHWIWFCCW